jgi:hypothetical protein
MIEVTGAADRLGRKLGYIFAGGKHHAYTSDGQASVIDLGMFTERLWAEAVSLEELTTARAQPQMRARARKVR